MVGGIRSLLKFTTQVYPPCETVIAGRSSIYVFSESPFKIVSRIQSLLKFTAQFTPHVTNITFTFTARVTFKFTAKVTFKFAPPFETVIDGRWHIAWTMSSVWAHLKWSPSPSSLLPKSPSSLLPNQSHLQVYPLIWNCHAWQMRYCLIYVFSESPFETA